MPYIQYLYFPSQGGLPLAPASHESPSPECTCTISTCCLLKFLFYSSMCCPGRECSTTYCAGCMDLSLVLQPMLFLDVSFQQQPLLFQEFSGFNSCKGSTNSVTGCTCLQYMLHLGVLSSPQKIFSAHFETVRFETPKTSCWFHNKLKNNRNRLFRFRIFFFLFLFEDTVTIPTLTVPPPSDIQHVCNPFFAKKYNIVYL